MQQQHNNNNDVKKIVSQLTNLKYEIFPISHPVPLTSDNIEDIKYQNYVISWKIDGVFQLLLLGRHSLSNQYFTSFISRSWNMCELVVSAPKYLFENGGSLFCGELISQRNKYVYYVFDFIAIGGLSVVDLSYIKRYEKLHQLFYQENNLFINTKIILPKLLNNQPLYFSPKAIFKLEQISLITKSPCPNNIKCDGIIFTPIDQKFVFGKQKNLYKWKEFHTIDLSFDHVSKKFYYKDIKENKFCDISYLKLEADHKTYEILISSQQQQHHQHRFTICECKFQNVNVKENETIFITLYRIRNDKKSPNTKETIQFNLLTTRHAINLNEIYEKITILHNRIHQC